MSYPGVAVKRCIGFTLGIALWLGTSIGAVAATDMLRIGDNKTVAFAQGVEDLAGADVIFIGDTHDDRRLHRTQLEIVKALYAKHPKLAIGLEMFTSDNQRYLDYWTNGQLEEKLFASFYAQNWNYDWSLYRDLFLFVRDNHIPLIAINVPKHIISKVARLGAGSLSASEKKSLPPGEIWSLNSRQVEYVRRIRAQVFGDAPASILPPANFEEAQALRNHAMAYNTLKYREKSPESKVVVVAGTWHAIKNGAPLCLKEYGSSRTKVVLPELVEFTRQKPGLDEADYLIPQGK